MFRSNPGLLWGLLFKWLAGMEIGKERRGEEKGRIWTWEIAGIYPGFDTTLRVGACK
jgi:hypothetical protein